jgi:hypothetical protein
MRFGLHITHRGASFAGKPIIGLPDASSAMAVVSNIAQTLILTRNEGTRDLRCTSTQPNR